MSYILDALRRADAERARGAVPGLHDQPLSARTTGDRAPAPAARPPWVWVAATLGAVTLVALAAWWWLRPTDSLQRQAAEGVLASAAIERGQPVPEVVVPLPVAPPVRGAVPVMPAPGEGPTTAAQAAPSPSPSPSSAPAPAVVTKAARPSVPAAQPSQIPMVAAPLPPKAAPVPRLAQLPEAVRRELPSLKVGGSMYSDSAASRILVLDGQMLHEGSTVVPGLVLERIGPSSARLRWHEQAFDLPY